MSKQFDHIINWELKAGSHEFPGPKGGTCINEAAIVAAGFEYRKVESWRDCPPCFSPVLSAFAITVNDMSGHQGRQDLMPLVTRLAGSRDDEEWVERARAEFIMREIDRDIFAPVYKWAFAELKRAMPEDAGLMDAAKRDAVENVEKRPTTAILAYAGALDRLTKMVRRMGPVRWLPPVSVGALCVSLEAYEARFEERLIDHDTIWRSAALALTRAFRIGTQAPGADTAKVVERMEAAKAARGGEELCAIS